MQKKLIEGTDPVIVDKTVCNCARNYNDPVFWEQFVPHAGSDFFGKP